MHSRFRWTFLLTLVVTSLVAAPLAVLAQDAGPGLNSFGLRGAENSQRKSETGTSALQNSLLFPRAFGQIVPNLGFGKRAVFGTDALATPQGFVPVSGLASMPPAFSRALTAEFGPSDAVILHFGKASSEEIHSLLDSLNVEVLGGRPHNAFVVTGMTAEAQAIAARADVTVLLNTAGLVVSDAIGVTGMPTQAMALNPELTLVAGLFRGEDAFIVTDLVNTLGGSVLGTYGTQVVFRMNIDTLADAVNAGAVDGMPMAFLVEQGVTVSADEDTNTGIQEGEFGGGRRPYTEAGLDGAGQIIGITDTGLSLDSTVLADSPAGPSGLGTSNAAGISHRKVIAYTDAGTAGTGGTGDGLSCDGSTGATHGHLVASIAAGNASELLADAGLSICNLSGFEPNISGCVTTHGVDGVAPGAKISFIDAQLASGCVASQQIETQTPGQLSLNSAAHAGNLARIHNYSFSILNSQGSYTAEAADIDGWLNTNGNYLVVAAAGNQGVDSFDVGNLDFGTVTSPGTAKNVLTVGSSGYPNNAPDPENGVIPNITNNGIELISRFSGLGSGQGPAAFTTQTGGTINWRMKPDVMAPGDENLGNQRMTAPTTCLSSDDTQAGPTECIRQLPGALFGTSYSSAAVSGLAAVVREYFAEGYHPAGQDGASASKDLTGQELKAAIIASTGLMTGNPSWQQLGGQLLVGFYNPKHLAGYTPEQGYGRVQADRLMPLDSEPDTPSFIQSELITLGAVSATASRDFVVLSADEGLTFAAAWYDEASTVAGPGAQGNLVNDVDMEVRDCGTDGCGDVNDILYFGNFFTEDTDFDGAITDIPDVFNCSTTTANTCDPGNTVCLDGPNVNAPCGDGGDCEDALPHTCDVGVTDVCLTGPNMGVACTDDADCTEIIPHSCVFDAVGSGCGGTNDPGGGAETCDLTFAAPDEDCNGNGILDSSEYSLSVTGQNCIQDPTDDGAKDRNNSTEKVRLSAGQLTEGNTVRVTLEWNRQNGGSDTSVAVGLVTTGGFTANGAPNSARLNKAEYACNDVVTVSIIDGASNASLAGISTGVTIESKNSMGTVIDTETALGGWTELSAGTRYSLPGIAAVDAADIPAFPNDTLLSVSDGGTISLTYADTPVATATATVRCTPSITINNIARRGTNANFDVGGGCDPRDRFDPRILVFGLVIGTGLNVTGDLYLDGGENLVYNVAFTNNETDTVLLNAEAELEACVAGSILSDGTCTQAGKVTIFDPVQQLGDIPPGKTQTASFNLLIDTSAAFPTDQLEMRFGVTASTNGLTTRSETVIHHALDVDTHAGTDEDPLVSGVYHYSTDFKDGGQELRAWAGEFFDPLNPDFAAELFTFQDLTSTAFGGGNVFLGDAITGKDCDMVNGGANCLAGNNMPWTFDLDDEGYQTRRRFDSDPGDNLQLQNANLWQHNTDGACGFQSNDRGTQTDGEGGTGGIWHTGFTILNDPSGDPDCTSGADPSQCLRDGYDLGCEDYDIPFTVAVDAERKFILDTVSSPQFGRVHRNLDSNGYAYTLEFTRLGANLQFSIGDGNTIMAGELDPDTTTPQPVDPLDMGWLFSDQGDEGFLAQVSQVPYAVFNPNDPHDPGSIVSLTGNPGDLNETPGPTQNIREIHEGGSSGSFYDPSGTCSAGSPNSGTACTLEDCGFTFDSMAPGNGQVPNALGGSCPDDATCGTGGVCEANDPVKAPSRAFGEVAGVLGTGRGLAVIGTAPKRGAGGFPLRNVDAGYDLGAGSFEDIFGPNETRDPGQQYPIGTFNEVLVNRRDTFQANFIAWVREDNDPNVSAVPDYGYGVDDVVAEWFEGHPVADRTPCTDTSTWAVDENRNPIPGMTLAGKEDLAGGCAQVSWDRANILSPEESLTLTVIDVNAQFGPNGVDDPEGPNDCDGDPLTIGNDDQAKDCDGDGLAELVLGVFSDVDLTGEDFTLEQIAFTSPVYEATVRVSTTKGKSSATDGIVFVQENGDGSNPTSVTAQYSDDDILVAGAGLPVACPDNPLTTIANTQFVGGNVLFVTAKVTDETGDGDSIADDNETVKLDIQLVNSVLDVNREQVTLENVTITLISDDDDVACILDGTANYGQLGFGIAAFNPSSDAFRFVVANVGRTDPQAVIQANFELGISAQYTDSLGVDRSLTSFATPQSFAINLDLDIANTAGPLISTSTCVGGTNSGFGCTTGADCPGLKGDGVTPASCDSLRDIYQVGGVSCTGGFCVGGPFNGEACSDAVIDCGANTLAGGIGYCESFEGAENMAGRNFAGSAIPGTSFSHLPGLNAAGGYLERAVRDYIQGGAGVLGGLSDPLGVRSAPGVAPDDPEGVSAVDGVRCQYNDPRGPIPGGRSESQCRPWDGSEWHVNDNKGFTGINALYMGMNGEEDLNLDISFDTNHTNVLNAAFSPPLNIGVAGGASLSIYHMNQMADDRTFNVPNGNAAGRGYLEVAVIDPATAIPIEGGWVKLNGFQNNYGNTGVSPFFVNCIFDSYDDFYDSPFPVPELQTQGGGVEYNADDVSNEDDYFNPNSNVRALGPSAGCFPQFVYSSLGNWSSTNTSIVGQATTKGNRGENGTGIWMNSLFSLDQFGGKTIGIRFMATDIDIAFGAVWADLFGNRLGNATRGWRIDDVCASGLVDTPLQLVEDSKTPPASACPTTEAGNCGSITADAGPAVITSPVSGALVQLSAAGSTFDQCVDGFLLYRWRIGGSIVQDYSTNAFLTVTPTVTTTYTVDVDCSTDRGDLSDPTDACGATAITTVSPADQVEASDGTSTALLGISTPSPFADGPVTITGEAPPIDNAPLTVRVDINHNAVNLASNLAALNNPTAGNIAATLKTGSCGLAIASLNPNSGGVITTTDSLTTLSSGEAVGYLQYLVTAAGPGSFGRVKAPGQPGLSGRGTLNPVTLGFPAPGTFANLSVQPAGTAGNCTP